MATTVFSVVFGCFTCNAQTLGGQTAFNFINTPNTAQLSALGGVNISSIGNNAALSFHNPAMLRSNMHKAIDASFNNYFANIKQYNIHAAFFIDKPKLNVAAGLQFYNYGNLQETDVSGNIIGNFKPLDFCFQLQASKEVYKNWHLGTTIKFIQSQYAQFISNAIAADVGFNYQSSNNLLQIGFLVKNVGTVLKTFNNNPIKPELPFNIQVGITKRLGTSPFQISLTGHQLQALSSFYNDTTFNNQIGASNNISTFQKISNRLILSTEIFFTDEFKFIAAYNFLRRQELNIINSTNGLNGWSFGLVVPIKKLQFHIATGFFQQNSYQQVSLQFNLADKGL
jgi:hypothetical protein